MINKHKSNKIKENTNTVRHLNNGTDHRHSKSCCDQSSPARRTIKSALDIGMPTLTPVASDILNDALRLDNELSTWAATCSSRAVTKVTTKARGLHIPL